MSNQVVFEPEKDITAFELAKIMAISNTRYIKKEQMFEWLRKECPSALRHFPNPKQSKG